ncbi:hypothetical protein [Thalassotalea euphylliae]|uniref:Uncharacterized protein n=1 Tax=Thalassotalea euphylliae TaxID=1655234 RepID=A0A3E0U2C1_9GAMM|nr:hypothetical protein [Thalassotalea euphylliae]REL31086.1 hypothetical protein DXX94_10370 [Thalassotalea euphylliae]
MQITYQNIGGVKLPAIAGHDKLTHFIYGAVAATATGGIAATFSGMPFASGALIGGALTAIAKEIIDYTVRNKQVTQANIIDTILDFFATAAGGVLPALIATYLVR